MIKTKHMGLIHSLQDFDLEIYLNDLIIQLIIISDFFIKVWKNHQLNYHCNEGLFQNL